MAVSAPTVLSGVTTAAGMSATGTITLTRPPGVQAGDLLVAILRTNGNTSPTDFTRAGWEKYGYPFIPSDPSGRVFTMLVHRITDMSIEPSAYAFAKTVSDDRQVAAMFALRGVDTTVPVSGQSPGTLVAEAPVIKSRSFSTDTATPQLLIYAWASEITAGNAPEPVARPAGSTQIILASSSAATGVTRSTIWIGFEVISTANVVEKALTWSTANGVAAIAVAFRGTDASVTPPASTVLKFQLRRGTAAQWNAANPILAQGEPGVNLTTGELKIGDGVTRWNVLEAISGGGSVKVVPNINSIPAGTPAGTILFQVT